MKKFIAMLMVLGLVGFAVAQDLDAPTSGVAVEEEANDDGGNNGAGIFDMLVARMNADRHSILTDHITGWWNAGFGYIGDWMGEHNRNNWGDAGDWDYLNANLTAAEKTAINQLASEIHNQFVAAGLN